MSNTFYYIFFPLWTAGVLLAIHPWSIFNVQSRTYYHLKDHPDVICYVLYAKGFKVKYIYYLNLSIGRILDKEVRNDNRYMFSRIWEKCENQNLPLGVKI